MNKLIFYSLIPFLALAIIVLTFNFTQLGIAQQIGPSKIDSSLISSNSLVGVKNPLCGRSDFTSLILNKIPTSGEKIVRIVRLHDDQYRYFVVTTKNQTFSLEKIWLFDIGGDKVFSNDDTVRLIFSAPSSRISDYAVLVSETTKVTLTGEELFWMEISSTGTKYIKNCQLPNCSNINFVATINPSINYELIDVEDFVVFPKDYSIYLLFKNLRMNRYEIRKCSLISTDLNWCGNNPDTYNVIHYSHVIDFARGVKNEGIAFSDWSGKKFFNVNNEGIVPISPGSRIQTVEWSGSPGINNFAFMIEEQNGTDLNLALLDTVSGASYFVDFVDRNIGLNFGSSPFDPRVGGYPVIVFDKIFNGSSKTYKKDIYGQSPKLVLDNSAYWQEIKLIVTKDRKAYSFDEYSGKLYSFDCG